MGESIESNIGTVIDALRKAAEQIAGAAATIAYRKVKSELEPRRGTDATGREDSAREMTMITIGALRLMVARPSRFRETMLSILSTV